ncbi:hypothetical protein [Xanthobacter sp. KR7-225]|uniref:hypothetical protein n=1 Tax=Xanthobacter sp. KR7-225 TaxID=3156613 RepID=UPI0032B35DD5
MSKSLVIGLSTVVVLAAALGGGGDDARALQFGAAPASQRQIIPAESPAAPGSPGTGAAVEKVGAAGPEAERDLPACGLRKIWVATDFGPRLKWRRPCEAD